MEFCVHIIDNPDAVETRKALVDAHRDYTVATGVEVLMSGPLLAEDRKTMIGSLIVVDLESRGAVMKFLGDDPFMTGGVWDRVEVHDFYWRVGRPEGLAPPANPPA